MRHCTQIPNKYYLMLGMSVMLLIIRSINGQRNQTLTVQRNYTHGVPGHWASTFVRLEPSRVRIWFSSKGHGKGGAVVGHHHHGPAGVVVNHHHGPIGPPAHPGPQRENVVQGHLPHQAAANMEEEANAASSSQGVPSVTPACV